jgi:Domain of unknown function (DUF4113)
MYRLRVRDHSTRPRPFHRYKKGGVTFLDPLLLDQPDDVPSLRRMRAIDQLNARFSRGTIGFGTAGERQAWSLRWEFTSPRFTTDRNEFCAFESRTRRRQSVRGT